MTELDKYIENQKNCGIRVGDEVMAMRHFEEDEGGHSAGASHRWAKKACFIDAGATGIVTKVNRSYIEVQCGTDFGGLWNFPYFVLKIVKKADDSVPSAKSITSDMTIIEQLKKNKRQLILMNSELQHAMLSMNPTDFFCLQDTSTINDLNWSPVAGDEWSVDANLHNTFRLRADYAEKPEIVECEICPSDLCPDQQGYFKRNGEWLALQLAFRDPGFIGFKFEDGSWDDPPIKPVNAAGEIVYGPILVADIISGAVIILHATHVLFWGQK